jgi:phosphonoacetate hydrolase
MTHSPITVNGVGYAWPAAPVVVVCIDGGDPAYFERGVADGIIPHTERFMREGFAGIADGTVPSFTCPNNMSLVTGVPAAVHGISGNYYLDRATGEAVVMTGPELLRADTVLAGFSRAGAQVVAITAKDKLRRQLAKGMDMAHGIAFSSEMADQCRLAEHGIENVTALVGLPRPGMYVPELSLFVLEAGIRLLETRRPQLMFLSLSDWVQHKYAPGMHEADDFYARLDDCFGRLDALGAVVALTADHGMNDKADAVGNPKVVWLQDVLDRELGAGTTRVICPITDAFVAHHGALGGFVRVWRLDPAVAVADIMAVARAQAGVERVLDGAAAAAEFDLPLDREGDVVVIGDRGTAIGAAQADHDLSGLAGHRLRSHGAPSEARVPFVINRPLTDAYRARARREGLKSYQIFDYALNGVVA